MNRTVDPPGVQQARIADAAIRVLIAQSWQGLDAAQVAHEANTTQREVDAWFSSRDELILGALARYHERYLRELREAIRYGDSVDERIAHVLDIALPARRAIADEMRFLIEVWAYTKVSARAHKTVRSQFAVFRGNVEELVRRALADVGIDPDSKNSVYPFIHAIIQGISLQAGFDPDVDVQMLRGQLAVLLRTWLVAQA